MTNFSLGFAFSLQEIITKLDFWSSKRRYHLSAPEAEALQKSLKWGLAAEFGGALLGGMVVLHLLRAYIFNDSSVSYTLRSFGVYLRFRPLLTTIIPSLFTLL